MTMALTDDTRKRVTVAVLNVQHDIDKKVRRVLEAIHIDNTDFAQEYLMDLELSANNAAETARVLVAAILTEQKNG